MTTQHESWEQGGFETPEQQEQFAQQQEQEEGQTANENIAKDWKADDVMHLLAIEKTIQKINDMATSPLTSMKESFKANKIIGQGVEYDFKNGITIYEQKSKVLQESDLISEIEKCNDKLSNANRKLNEFREHGYIKNEKTPSIAFKINADAKMIIEQLSHGFLQQLVKGSPIVKQIAENQA